MISIEKQNEIVQLRANGKGVLEISILLKVGLATVSKFCKKYDPLGKLNKTWRLSKEIKEEIVIFYLTNGKSLNKTVKQFNTITRQSVRDILITRKVYQKKTNITTNKRKSQHVINWKRNKKIELVKYKGGKCERCGYNKCIAALDFHHKDPSQKLFNISTNSFSFEKMRQEADKCELLCANCHREETHKIT